MTAPAVPILPCIVAFNAEGGFEFLVVRGHACSTSIEGRLTSRVSLEGVRISSIGGGRNLGNHDALWAPYRFCFHNRTAVHSHEGGLPRLYSSAAQRAQGKHLTMSPSCKPAVSGM